MVSRTRETEIARERYEQLPGWPSNPTDYEAWRQRRKGIRALQSRYEAALREKNQPQS